MVVGWVRRGKVFFYWLTQGRIQDASDHWRLPLNLVLDLILGFLARTWTPLAFTQPLGRYNPVTLQNGLQPLCV